MAQDEQIPMEVGLDHPAFPERIRRQDPLAFEAVIRAYLSQVIRAARGAGFGPDQAEDVAQATFMTLLETAQRFEGRSHIRTWVFGILYKKISEARRKAGRDRDMDDIDEVFEQRFDSHGSWSRPPRPVEAEAFASEIRSGLVGCLDEVSTKQRMAFILRDVEDLKSEEVCNILDVTRTNLGVLLMRARNRLRECLESKGIQE